jgi:hypothetical protein
MRSKIVVYCTDTGEVQSVRSGTFSSITTNLPENCDYIVSETPDVKDMYVVEGTLQPLPESVLEERAIAKAWKRLKARRARRLQNSDWTQVPDAPVDAAAWAVYRQQLRDLPANTTDPRNVEWPEPPS